MNNRMTYAEQQMAKKKDMTSGIVLTVINVALIVVLFSMMAKQLGA